VDTVVLLVFAGVYLGMVVGGIPGLALDRTGVALLGAIILLATGRVGVDEAWAAIDVPTIGLLFGLMVLSAQFRLGGAYTAVTRHLAETPFRPGPLLGLVIAAAAVLSALLANDIVCLAMAPLLVEGCARRKLDPRPFVLALACASNIGSAATLIGNPQNMLIGQKLSMSFAGYLLDGVVPAAAGCLILWAVLVRQVRGRWAGEFESPPVEAPPFDGWQTLKGLVILGALVAAFIASSLPREVLALAAAGVILLSRKMYSRAMLGLVDWQLLVLFISLFVVNHALGTSGMLDTSLTALREGGVDIARPAPLFAVTAVLSNIVSNVPAVMLLLPAASHPQAGAILALSSTLAGNLFIAGSIANIIVLDQAGRLGLRIGWREHARLGVPVTILTLAMAAGWLVVVQWLRG
jgi:Na+/H+ antiporter NhaD/arsenite permease-like protein